MPPIDDAVADIEDFRQFMGDEDDALPLRPQSSEDRQQLGDFARREIGGRLVEDHELRVAQHGFQDLDPLPATPPGAARPARAAWFVRTMTALLEMRDLFRKVRCSDVAAARAAWREKQPTLDPRKLVFIDETWASTNMTPRYGRCEIGKRLIGYTPFGHWKTTTFLAALRHDGLTAPCVFDGAINGEKFAAYIEQELVATLSPGDIVIMDNLSAHKRAAVKIAIEAAGAELRFLPPTAPISIRSSRLSPSSKPFCANSPGGRSKASGAPAPSQPMRSSPKTAETSSSTQDTQVDMPEREPL